MAPYCHSSKNITVRLYNKNEQAKTASQAHTVVMAQAIQELESMKLAIAAMLSDTYRATEHSFVLS